MPYSESFTFPLRCPCRSSTEDNHISRGEKAATAVEAGLKSLEDKLESILESLERGAAGAALPKDEAVAKGESNTPHDKDEEEKKKKKS
jgi:hypothetical protein